MVWIEAEVDLEKLATDLRHSLNKESMMRFILDLDLKQADLEFTTELYARLGDALRKELESDG